MQAVQPQAAQGHHFFATQGFLHIDPAGPERNGQPNVEGKVVCGKGMIVTLSLGLVGWRGNRSGKKENASRKGNGFAPAGNGFFLPLRLSSRTSRPGRMTVGHKTLPEKMKRSPGRYQELDLFIKVLRLLCPNLTDASGPRSFHSLVQRCGCR